MMMKSTNMSEEREEGELGTTMRGSSYIASSNPH